MKSFSSPLLFLVVVVVLVAVVVQVQGVKKPPTPPPIKSQASYCDALPPFHQDCPAPTDIMFMVDASNSLNRTLFYTNMMDYLLQVYCVLDPKVENRAGMLTFAQEIKVQIPMKAYTRNDWQAKINAVKADPTACCSCCTPTAEVRIYLSKNQNKYSKKN
jgi:hypothetical protein